MGGITINTGITETGGSSISVSQATGAAQIGTAGLNLPTIVFCGDSTVSQNDTLAYQTTGSTTTAITRYGRAIGWIDRLTGGALNYDSTIDPADNLRKGSNAGVGGSDMLELLTRLTTGDTYTAGIPILNRTEKYVWVQIGTNDINAGISLANLITRMTNIITAILAANKIPIICTVLPRNAVDGANDWSNTAGGTTTAQKRLVLNSYNNWLGQYCRENNVICIPWHGVFSDTTGQAVTGYTTDGLHPNDRGGWYLAQFALNCLNGLLPKSVKGQLNAYDVFDATYNPYGNVLNGDLSGTGGAFSQGTGTGVVGGELPDNFQLAKATATTTNCSAAIVSRLDGQPGNMIYLKFTSNGSGASSEDWRLNYWTGATTSLTGFASAGDILAMEAEFVVVSGTPGLLRTPQVRIGMNSGITYTASTISFNGTTNTIADSAAGFNFPASAAVNVAGTTNNNKVFRILTQTSSLLTLTGSVSAITEAAGASVTIRLPAQSSVTNASTENFPTVDTGSFYERIPSFIVPTNGAVSPRMAFFINGTITGTAEVYIARPSLAKKPFKPALLNITATDS